VREREGLLLTLDTDDGRRGLGEAVLDPSAADGGALLAQTLRALAPGLISRDVESVDVAGVVHKDDDGAALRAVACGLDTALCDLLAQGRGVSMAQLLRPQPQELIEVNALVMSVMEAASEASAARDAGYRSLKLKVGVMRSLKEELGRVAAVREALGSEIKLRLDPNGAWSEAEALAAIEAFAVYDIEYVEQPIAPGDLAAMARLHGALDVAIAADEDVTDFVTAQRIIESRAADVLVLKPQRLGGLGACLQIIEAARAAGVHCVVTTTIDAGVGTAAALHLAATAGSGLAHGLATAALLESDLTQAPLTVLAGAMAPAAGPGLGVALDEAALARYAVGAWETCT
jgi:o-succinylbenzoate synthase